MSIRDQGRLERRVTGGPALYFYSTFPAGEAEAVVALLHGYGEHAARYAHVASALAERAIASIAVDLRGHGRSEGDRGCCEHFGEYLDDAAELARLVTERRLPSFVLGHSFGGLVAASFLLSRPSGWRGLVLSSPFFGFALDVPPLKRAVGRIASRILPKLALPTGIRGADLTHDVERIRAVDDDPLYNRKATARWYTETLTAQERAVHGAPSLRVPLYLVASGADRVAKVERARAFFDAAGNPDKTWLALEGLFHEVLNEPEWAEITKGIADWILARRAEYAPPPPVADGRAQRSGYGG
ncbi:MAG: lysophospholipase [Myxococcota bacterium]|nr:lysophospholipase [Myxococcota bacterium]